MRWGYLSTLWLSLFSFFSVGAIAKNPPTTVKVEIEKYKGRWHELARLPNRFQKGCISSRADYAPINNSTQISVSNVCKTNSTIKQVKGKAYPVKPNDHGKLKVSFFWPFKGDYWVLYVKEPTKNVPGSAEQDRGDGRYQLAIVGTPDRKYLWLLSRSKTLTQTDCTTFFEVAKNNGYKQAVLDKLIWSNDNSCDRHKRHVTAVAPSDSTNH